jgi:diaminohydroxyphosphoribosylaminopyrimidine deaminase / 5-amino-6-(5-phosphoribosylamino)uracil reductase
VTQAPAIRELLDESSAWALIRALAKRASSGQPVRRACGLSFDGTGTVREVAAELGLLSVNPEAERAFRIPTRATPAIVQMLDLYLPLCLGDESPNLVFGHMGQSLDAQIATASGASRYVTGPQNIQHMHRLRALCDAVVVGAGTVERDDPQLTTRLVPGDNPTRVVIDPNLRLSSQGRLFQDDDAPTLVVCARGNRRRARRVGRAEIVEVTAEGNLLPPHTILEELRQRGLRRIFVEGGGVTVSRFLEGRALGRLHVTICPIFIGKGRPGISLPAIDDLGEALRPRTRRFDFGEDVLFDCLLDLDA